MNVKYQYCGVGSIKAPLEIDELKALWLKRMCVGEGGENCSYEKAQAMLWAMTNRWFMWKGARFYPSFLSMVRAFSQPINPRWMTGGDLARKYIGRSEASASRLARRAAVCAMTEFKEPIRKAVIELMEGILPYPEPFLDMEFGRVTNWASLPSTPKKYPWGINIDGDWFFEDRNLRDKVVIVVGRKE